MKIPLFKVTRTGVQATIQDLGRRGCMQEGFAQGGCLDQHAALWANHLLGVKPQLPVVEITLGQFSIQFLSDSPFSLCGADLSAQLDGNDLQPWCTYHAYAGQILSFGVRRSGVLAYLAFGCEFALPLVHGSFSTVVREQLGGYHGRALRKGDIVSTKQSLLSTSSIRTRKVAQKFVPDYQKPLHLELIPGYQFEDFDRHAIHILLTHRYRIITSSNRMAYQLSGKPLTCHQMRGLPSEGIAYATVEVIGDGILAVLLNDRQTIGGYPRLGCLSRRSAFELVQQMPHTEVHFALVDCDEARKQWQQMLRFF